MPASRRARAMILAPRSCPSRPGLATTTLILRPPLWRSRALSVASAIGCAVYLRSCSPWRCWRAGGTRPSAPPRPPPLETVVQDDALLLYRNPAQVRRTVQALALLGVDRVRLTAGWSAIAPDPQSTRRPAFDAADPSAYPPEGWRRLTVAVHEVERAGMKPLVDVAFWAPRWAVERGLKPAGRQRYVPSPREFGLFAEAAARRLPSVRLWTTWNEPNHPTFLLPQWIRRDGAWIPYSPHLYREMHERAYDAVKSVNPHNRVLLGGLASIDRAHPGETSGMPPLLFLRELACVDERLEPLRRPECSG